jgi:hypothetical protein
MVKYVQTRYDHFAPVLPKCGLRDFQKKPLSRSGEIQNRGLSKD